VLRRLRTFARLDSERRSVFVKAVLLLPLVRPALRILGFKRLRDRIEARPCRPQVSREERRWVALVAEMVEVAGRRGLIRANCLDRSLLLHWIFARRGIPVELRIGVDRSGDGLRAHAWIECAGEVLGDPTEVARVFGVLE